MKVESIKIKNYRQYDNICFDFKLNGSNQLHLVIASNGVGKTNFLNAITWCLYEEESHLGIQSRSLPLLNLSVVDSLKEGESRKVEVIIKFIMDGDKYIAKRTKNCTKKEDLENNIYMEPSVYELSIFKGYDELPEILYNNEAENYMNNFLPESVNEYFFFDNEQLDSYFITNEAQTIKSAIIELSQVQLLSKSMTHLKEIIKEYRNIVKKTSPALEKVQNEVDRYEGYVENYTENIKEYEEQIRQSEAKIEENKIILKGTPNIKEEEEKLDGIDSELKGLKDEKKEKTLEIHSFIREYTIVLRLYLDLKKTLSIIEEQEEKGNLPINVNIDILKEILEDGECYFCKSDIDEDGKSNIQELIDNIKFSSDTSALLMKIKTEVIRLIDKAENYPNVKTKLLKNFDRLNNKINELEREKRDIKDKLSSRTDSEQLKKLIIENEKHEAIVKDNREYLVMDKKRKDKAKIDLVDKQDAYSRELKKNTKHTETQKLLQFSRRAYDVMEESYTELLEEMKNEISKKSFELFSSFIWKSNTYKNVIIDDNFNIDIIHKSGYSCIGSCSAAERALLALSFTLALHDVAGFYAPLVIDSPVGRVSDKNRKKFGEVLSKVSETKQIIMLFTPSEYSEEIKDLFDRKASNKFDLDMDQELTTNITGGVYNG
jgi:DNA sulfur modification protein DndD